MFVAMFRFRVRRGDETAFEAPWLSRESYLPEVPGFVAFNILKGPQAEDHTLYVSHSVWDSEAAYGAWTHSEAFRLAHRDAERNLPLILGAPALELFEVLKTVTPAK